MFAVRSDDVVIDQTGTCRPATDTPAASTTFLDHLLDTVLKDPADAPIVVRSTDAPALHDPTTTVPAIHIGTSGLTYTLPNLPQDHLDRLLSHLGMDPVVPGDRPWIRVAS